MLFLFFLSTFPALLRAQAAPAADGLFLSIESMCARQEYAAARETLSRRLAAFPDDVDAVFLKVAVEQSVLEDYESYLADDNHFLPIADSAHRVLERRLRGMHGTDSLRCAYYLAAIEGGIALFQGKTGSWVGALKNASSSASGFKMVMKRDSTMYGALLGLGVYHYYLGKSFGWLPFINAGSEEEGIREIDRAACLPFPCDFSAKCSLCWILIDRREFAAADSVAASALAEAPQSTLFLQVRALALYREGRFTEAIVPAGRLAALSGARTPVNWSDLVLSSMVLCGSYDALGKGGQAKAAANFILNAAMPEEYKKMAHIKRNMKKIEEIAEKYDR
jgi:tetratricopeptide (TPR) repeat protein